MCSEPGCDLPARARGMCSKHYMRAWTRERPRPCRGCQTPLPPGQRVLCTDCRYPLRPCSACGDAFRGRPEQSFCSKSCASTVKALPTGRSSVSWTGGHRGYRGPGWKRIRERIRERDGWACRECGATKEQGTKLDVHHIVAAEDWTNPGPANDPSNLLTLCVDCHARKHWDGSWAGRRVSPALKAERDAERAKTVYQRNRDKKIAAATRWNQENKERRNARARARRAERRQVSG